SRLEIKPTQLAKEANLAPSTLNRFMAGAGGARNLGARTIVRLLNAANEILSKSAPPPSREQVDTRIDPSFLEVRHSEVIEISVVGQLRAGVSVDYPGDNKYNIKIPIPLGNMQRGPIVGFELTDIHAIKE